MTKIFQMTSFTDNLFFKISLFDLNFYLFFKEFITFDENQQNIKPVLN